MSEAPEIETPAQRIVRKCGGISQTAKLAQTSENWVYRWLWSGKEGKGGTNGRVPPKAQINLLAAAKEGKADISPADFFPVAGE